MSGQEPFGQGHEQAGQGGEEYLDKEPDKLPGKGQEDDKDISDAMSDPDSDGVYPEFPGFFFRRFAQVVGVSLKL